MVSTPLKNISQLGCLLPIYGKIKNVPNHQPDSYYECICESPLSRCWAPPGDVKVEISHGPHEYFDISTINLVASREKVYQVNWGTL